MTEKIKTAQHLYEALAGNIGTQCYYILPHAARLKYTDGVKEMASLLGAYWLIELIGIHLDGIYAQYPHLRGFAIVRVKSYRNAGVVDILSDNGDENKEISYPLEYTDFPEGEFEMYLINGVLLLKSEY